MKKIRTVKLKLKRVKIVVKQWLKQAKKIIKDGANRYSRIILYSFGFTASVVFIVLSFFFKSNGATVSSSVGTGLLTSLIVSVTINYANDKRQKKEIEQKKKVVLSGIHDGSIEVYRTVIYQINKYIMLRDIPLQPFYELYKDFSQYRVFKQFLEKTELSTFERILEETELSKLSSNEHKLVEELFDFSHYSIYYLVAELKRLPKHEYYIKEILEEAEFEGLASNLLNDKYIEQAEQIKSFWDTRIVDYKKCIGFLQLTLYISSKIISSIEYFKVDAIKEEKNIKDRLELLYYEEIYAKSDEYLKYLREQEEEEEEIEKYYSEHPEEYEKAQAQLAESLNETPEDANLRCLHLAICGISIYHIDDLLNMIDSNSEKALLFVAQNDIQAALKKDRKKRKAIEIKFGKGYLKRAKKLIPQKPDGLV